MGVAMSHNRKTKQDCLPMIATVLVGILPMLACDGSSRSPQTDYRRCDGLAVAASCS